MSMSDTIDDEQDVPGAGLAAWNDGASTSGMGSDDPRAPVSKFGADAPVPEPSGLPGGGGGGGGNAGEEPQDMSPAAVRQRQRDFVPNALKSLRDKAQSNYPQQEQTEGTSGPRKAVGEALAGANENYPENEQQGGGAQLPSTIMRYLAGADADPQLTKQAEDGAAQVLSQVSDGTPSQSDVRLMALHTAAEHGGDEAGYKVQQTYRASYNASMGHAHVALSGAGGKPPDLAAATDAATKASTYVLDGSTTTFAPSGGGVTATVKYAGSQQPQVFQLTIPQFNQLTDIGDVNGGQYDAIHENGATLQKIAQGPGKPVQAPQQGAPQQGAPQQARPAAPQPSPQPGAAPADHPFQYAADEGVDPKLVARSHALFPSVGQEQQRLQYLDKMEQQGVSNRQSQDKIDTGFAGKKAAADAKVTAEGVKQAGQNTTAQTRGNFYLDHANIIAASKTQEGRDKMELEMHRLASQQTNAQLRDQVTMAAKMVGTEGASGTPMTPEQAKFVSDTMAKTQQAPQVPQAPAPRAAVPRAQTPAGPSAPQPGEKIVNGVRYTRGPNGEAVRVPGQ